MSETVSPDARGRVSLGRLLPEGVDQFLAHREPDGTVILEPAVVMTRAEANLHADTALHARLVAEAQPGAKRIRYEPEERRRARRRRTAAGD